MFETRWLGLYRIGRWDFARRPNADAAVGILAVTPADEVVLIEQFRHPMQRSVIEVPAGLVGDEEEFIGESLAETAGRELVRHTAQRLEPVIRAIGGAEPDPLPGYRVKVLDGNHLGETQRRIKPLRDVAAGPWWSSIRPSGWPST